ncbi:MAG: hypothetical protein WBN97_07995 [Parvibaculum sp.]
MTPAIKPLVAAMTIFAALLTFASADETYRLILANGNVEKEIARGLSKYECEVRKKELKAVAESLGTYNEALGIGSITCLPESLFED